MLSGKLLPLPNKRRGFTLIELLVVIAIIAILSVVVILTLNPAELLRSSRDSNRVADMGTITTALGIFSEDQSSGSLGAANTVYVSIPDPTATSTLGDQCQGLGLPTLPATYSYHCAASSTYRNINGTGWIPVNFSSISVGSPLGSLSIDPLNTSSTRNYYTYTTNTTQYEITAAMESQKYKLGGANDVVGSDGSILSTVYAKGSNLSLEPLDYGDTSLVGYWPLTEGTGTVAYDYSGSNATGTWNGTAMGTSGYYSPGKIGPWAGAFDGTSTNIYIGQTATPGLSTYSESAWFKTTIGQGVIVGFGSNGANCSGALNYDRMMYLDSGGHLYYGNYNNGGFYVVNSSLGYSDGNWHYAVGTLSSAGQFLYIDGKLIANISNSASQPFNGYWHIGCNNVAFWPNTNNPFFSGSIDDVRIYNRALSASEIAAMYAGGK